MPWKLQDFQRINCPERLILDCQQGYCCLRGNTFAAPGEAEPFGGGRFDADGRQANPEQFSQTLAHRITVRANLGRFANDRQIDIADCITLSGGTFHSVDQETV